MMESLLKEAGELRKLWLRVGVNYMSIQRMNSRIDMFNSHVAN